MANMQRAGVVFRGFWWSATGSALLLAGCSSGGPETAGVAEQPVICGTNDFQNVAMYAPVDGVPRSFIDEHERPVVRCGSSSSGVLLGDGLYLSGPGCSQDALLMEQLGPNGEVPALQLRYHPVSLYAVEATANFMINRLELAPENYFGIAGIEARAPSVDERIVAIGHPVLENAPPNPPNSRYEVAEVGRVGQTSSPVIAYRDLDTAPGMVGAPIFSAETGRLVGLHQTEGDFLSCRIGGGGTAKSMAQLFAESSVIKGDP